MVIEDGVSYIPTDYEKLFTDAIAIGQAQFGLKPNSIAEMGAGVGKKVTDWVDAHKQLSYGIAIAVVGLALFKGNGRGRR